MAHSSGRRRRPMIRTPRGDRRSMPERQWGRTKERRAFLCCPARMRVKGKKLSICLAYMRRGHHGFQRPADDEWIFSLLETNRERAQAAGKVLAIMEGEANGGIYCSPQQSPNWHENEVSHARNLQSMCSAMQQIRNIRITTKGEKGDIVATTSVQKTAYNTRDKEVEDSIMKRAILPRLLGETDKRNYRFVNKSGLVEDPLQSECERLMQHCSNRFCKLLSGHVQACYLCL